MQTLESWIADASSFVWGPYLLIPLLLATGVFLTLKLKGIQFTRLGHALYLGLVVRKEEGAEGDISHFQALMTALAATVGTGNIVGVATAISLGGPGALFWMWMTGLFGMATKYSEALLSVKYRTTDEHGEQAGGPMYYLERGVGGGLGKTLAVAFAVFGAVAAFGIGNMVQSNSVATAVQDAFGVTPWITGVVLAVAAAAVLLGGIRSIGRVTGVLVPFMIVAYMAGCLWVLIVFAERVPEAFAAVFSGAFTGHAAVGGAVGVAVRYGVARGIFSNESGLGSAGIAAAAAQTRRPATQALVSMTQTFIDTLVVCSMTGLALLVTGSWLGEAEGAEITQQAFRAGMGEIGGVVVALALAMFAFSTILGWSYYGEKCLEYLLGVGAVKPYRLLFVVAVYVGTVRSLSFVWTMSDLMNGLMALPNLVGLILLAGVIRRESFASGE